MCLLRLSSVVKDHTLSYYPDAGDVNYKHSFNCNIRPRIINILPKYFPILPYRNEKIGTFVMPEKFPSNRFYHCYLQSPKKCNPSHTSSAFKKNCLKLPKVRKKLPKIGSLTFRFNKGNQSKLETKPCIKPLMFLSQILQPTSSIVSSS